MRVILGVVVLVALGALAWMLRLPSKAECAASGRVVDPTERHCESGASYEQLQEHALFHASEVVVGMVVLAAVGYAVYRYRRRRS